MSEDESVEAGPGTSDDQNDRVDRSIGGILARDMLRVTKYFL